LNKICERQEKIKIVSESDTHIGSSSGLLPSIAESFDGNIYTKVKQNAMQRWMWKNRLDDLSTIGKADVYLFLGDSVEGKQIRMGGRTLQSADIDDQIEWAKRSIQVALDLIKPKYFIGISGTNYHIRSGGNADLTVYKMLGKDNPNIKFFCEDIITMQIGDLIWGLAHPYPNVQYSAPPLEKLISQHAIEYYLGSMPKISVFARGHAHRFTWLQYRGGIYAYVNPCWQPTSAYGRSRPYLSVRTPDVGLLELTQIKKTLTPMPHLHIWRV